MENFLCIVPIHLHNNSLWRPENGFRLCVKYNPPSFSWIRENGDRKGNTFPISDQYVNFQIVRNSSLLLEIEKHILYTV